MADIQQFIQTAASSLGVSEDVAGSATGGLIQIIKDNLAGDDFAELTSKLPGVAGMLSDTTSGPDTSSGGGGLLGGLAGAASALGVGGGAAGALGTLGALGSSGLSAEKIGSLASLFLDFVKSNAGEGLATKILSQVPDLKSLLG
jgi:hypothetical protein